MKESRFHILLDILFVGLYIIILAVLYELGRLPRQINILDLVLLGLATARLADIISTDEIMQWLRRPFVKMEQEEMAGQPVQVRQGRGSGLRNVIGNLLSCPWCVAVWVAAGLTYVYFLIPNIAWLFVLVLAIAEIGSLIQTTSTILVRIEKYMKCLGVKDEGL